jgi:TetR/AcrR family transcriptional regulator, transcriptional repressor of aconitase
MPRVTAAHEQAVRQRIVDAAIRVFRELGFQKATIQDVVRESGLSVGAVYTHFKGKEELFLEACTCEMAAEKADLTDRLAELENVSDRLRAAIDYAIDSAVFRTEEGQMRIHAWIMAEGSTDLRSMLSERHEQMVKFAQVVLQVSVDRGELPAWIDLDGLAAAFITLIDGFAVRTAEGSSVTRDQVRREAYALVDLLLAAPMERPAGVDRLRAAAAQLG